MTLQEVAAELARRLDAQVEPGDDPNEVTVIGKGYQIEVTPFFGGWQAVLSMADAKTVTFYGEAVEVLELRIKARLSGREYRF